MVEAATNTVRSEGEVCPRQTRFESVYRLGVRFRF
jgi:hypothetical protein